MTEEQPKTDTKKKKSTPAGKQSPLHVIRDGGIAASIWEKTTGHGMTYLEYSISRSWKSKSGTSGYSQSFFSRNAKALINVIEQATKWISEAEAKDQARQAEDLAA